MKCDILVVTHKRFDDSFVPKGYKIIAVGEDKEGNLNCYENDRSGQSIADKNAYYSELTAQYWAWKNLQTEICGLVHYRRFFVDYDQYHSDLRYNILSASSIEKILASYKVILPTRNIKAPGTGVYYTDLPETNQDSHWKMLRSIIADLYPEYLDSFSRVMRRKLYSPCNMFIATKEIFDDYSEWLFKILAEYDLRLEKKGADRLPRVDGYLSECLLNIYFSHNFSEKEIRRIDFANVESLSNSISKLKFMLLSSRILKFVKLTIKYINYIPGYKKYLTDCRHG